MGLDMYAFNMRNVNEEEKKRFLADPENQPEDIFVFYLENRSPEEMATIEDLIPYSTKLVVPVRKIDIKKIMTVHNIPESSDAWIARRSPEEIEFAFSHEVMGDPLYITHSIDEIEEKFLLTSDEEVMICHVEKVAYWRKQYDLQNMIYDLYDKNICNCGYHLANKDMIDAMNSFGANLPELQEGEAIFYHEWY